MGKVRTSSSGTMAFDPAELESTIARRVLLDLLELQPELKITVAALADESIKNPRMEDLAAEIEGALNRICAGDIYMDSGRTWDGYREVEEAVAEAISETLQPYFERVEKLLRAKDNQKALILCEAIILGLYHAKDGDQFSDLEEEAAENIEETADWAARLWRSAGNIEWASDRRFLPDRTIPADFVQQYVPDWDWLLGEGKQSP